MTSKHRNVPRLPTTTVSFRVNAETASELERFAKQEHITTSSLLTQIVVSYLEWDSIASKAGMIPVQKDAIQLLIETKTDDELEKIADVLADRFLGTLLMITGELTLDAFLRVTKVRSKKSDFTFKQYSNGRIQVVVRHGMGRKWSVFFSTFSKIVVNRLGYAGELEIADDMWVLAIDRKKRWKQGNNLPVAS